MKDDLRGGVAIWLLLAAMILLSGCITPVTTATGALLGGGLGGGRGALIGAGAGMAVGAAADYAIYGPEAFRRPAYANGRYGYYGYGIVSCSELPTMSEQDRCERAAQRSAERERERELRERLHRADRIGDELGRGRY